MRWRGRTLPITCKRSSKDRRANAGREGTTRAQRSSRRVRRSRCGAGTGAAGSSSLIDEIVREGARRMLAEALQAEADAYIAAFGDENGRRLVVRNGSHQRRDMLTSARGGGGSGTAGQRPAQRSGDGPAAVVLLGDLAAVLPQGPEGHRGAAPAVSARALL